MLGETWLVLSAIVVAMSLGVLGLCAQGRTAERRRQEREDQWWADRGE